MAKKQASRQTNQGKDKPVDAEIRRAAERIGHVPADAEARIRDDERHLQEVFYVSTLVRIGDLASELRSALDDGPTHGAGSEVFTMILDQINREIWAARWDSEFKGGDKRIGICEVAS